MQKRKKMRVVLFVSFFLSSLSFSLSSFSLFISLILLMKLASIGPSGISKFFISRITSVWFYFLNLFYFHFQVLSENIWTVLSISSHCECSLDFFNRFIHFLHKDLSNLHNSGFEIFSLCFSHVGLFGACCVKVDGLQWEILS